MRQRHAYDNTWLFSWPIDNRHTANWLKYFSGKMSCTTVVIVRSANVKLRTRCCVPDELTIIAISLEESAGCSFHYTDKECSLFNSSWLSGKLHYFQPGRAQKFGLLSRRRAYWYSLIIWGKRRCRGRRSRLFADTSRIINWHEIARNALRFMPKLF